MKWWGIDQDFYSPPPPWNPFPQVNNRYVVKQQYSNPLNKLYFSPSQPRFYSCQKLKMVLPWLRCIDIAFPSIYSLKGSYDAFLKIIIWCNRICWHALMFKKHIIFQILYIIVGLPLSFSTKSLLPTSTVCSDWPTDPVHCDWPNTASTRRKCNAPFHNRELQLSKWM